MSVSTLSLVSVIEAADFLGITTERVRQFCREGRLGQQVGDRWVIPEDELKQFAKIPRPNGRPKGPKSTGQ